jgi:hypothetical protein
MSMHMTFASHHSAAGRKATFMLGIAFYVLGMGASASAQNVRITTFDAPGAGTASGQGTFVSGINAPGVIDGYYTDANNVSHGFLRSRNGKLTTFDAPGAANLAGFGTVVLGMNDESATVGVYWDANEAAHGFLRSPDGKFTTFVSPKECTTGVPTGCHGTGAWSINDFGTIVGPYEDTSGNFVAHTFIRSPDGKFKVFAVPGSSMLAGQGTLPVAGSGLNIWGSVTGLYYDANNVFHGFLRSPFGTYIDFEAPGADTTDAFYGTFPATLNDFDVIAGDDLDANGVYHGFVRGPEGKFTTFDAPGADTGTDDFNGTFPEDISLLGVIAGYYTDANYINHGFLRYPNGGFTTVDAPGAGTGNYQGTIAIGNNLEGTTTGYVLDDASVAHGFVTKH